MGALSLSNEYRSPERIVSYCDARWGPFTLDVAAASWNAQALRYFTKRQNGLRQAWSGRVWMNPPYSRGQLDVWMAKARQEVLERRVELVCCLVPAYTAEGWWHDSVERPAGELRRVEHQVDEVGAWTTYAWHYLRVTVGRLRGRLRHREQRGTMGTARFSSAVVVFDGRRWT
jgi:phage N-6-adenine-methyltransferase